MSPLFFYTGTFEWWSLLALCTDLKGLSTAWKIFFGCGSNEKMVPYIDENEHPCTLYKGTVFITGPESCEMMGSAILRDECRSPSVMKNQKIPRKFNYPA